MLEIDIKIMILNLRLKCSRYLEIFFNDGGLNSVEVLIIVVFYFNLRV